LDEIGEITAAIQVKLLRFLQETEYRPLGSTRTQRVNVRIVAATNKDLTKAIEEGSFREDLYYRLNIIPITLPPLRDRKEDIPLLVERFLETLAVELGKRLEGVSADALAALMSHSWPGNVRELRNVLERGAVVAQGSVIQIGDLGLRPTGAAPGGKDRVEPPSLDEIERRHVVEVLSFTGGNVTQAARILGIDRVTLYNKMRRYQLQR
ncbi:MAG TPA: sigma 54-interacting transcriptional regulator, partial [Anaeromyxobacteraceae bacterium]|nr:sigma 54-interacting transcriptional regulator [Anaeromyxobacteraceae bacterium]